MLSPRRGHRRAGRPQHGLPAAQRDPGGRTVRRRVRLSGISCRQTGPLRAGPPGPGRGSPRRAGWWALGHAGFRGARRLWGGREHCPRSSRPGRFLGPDARPEPEAGGEGTSGQVMDGTWRGTLVAPTVAGPGLEPQDLRVARGTLLFQGDSGGREGGAGRARLTGGFAPWPLPVQSEPRRPGTESGGSIRGGRPAAPRTSRTKGDLCSTFPVTQPGTSLWKASWVQCLEESVGPTLCFWEGRGHAGTGVTLPYPWWAGWVAETAPTQWAASRLGAWC